MPILVRAGSARTQATSPGARAASSAGDVVELHHPGGEGGVHLRPQVGIPPAGGAGLVGGHEGLVDAAVIAPVEDQDLGAAGEMPGDAEREAVCVGGRERELPERESEAPGELRRHPDGVLRGQHGGDASGCLPLDRFGHEGSGVTGHGPRVAEGEVDVLVAVDVGEARAIGARAEDGERPRPARHPGHGHSRQQMLVGLRAEGRGTRMGPHEPFSLVGEPAFQPLSVDFSHLASHRPARRRVLLPADVNEAAPRCKGWRPAGGAWRSAPRPRRRPQTLGACIRGAAARRPL